MSFITHSIIGVLEWITGVFFIIVGIVIIVWIIKKLLEYVVWKSLP